MASQRPRTIRVIFTKSPTFWSRVIRLFTMSRYSHAAIVLPENDVIDTDHPQGVTMRKLDDLLTESSAYEIIKVPVKNPKAAYDFLRSQIGKPYDYGGVFSFIVKRNWQDPDKWFCSELVTQALIQAKADGLEFTEARKVTPEDLYNDLSA